MGEASQTTTNACHLEAKLRVLDGVVDEGVHMILHLFHRHEGDVQTLRGQSIAVAMMTDALAPNCAFIFTRIVGSPSTMVTA